MPGGKYPKVNKDVLGEYVATVEANPQITEAEILQKFPEFDNSPEAANSAGEYYATLKEKNFQDETELEVKFPEFFDSVKKKEQSSLASPTPLLASKQAIAPEQDFTGFLKEELGAVDNTQPPPMTGAEAKVFTDKIVGKKEGLPPPDPQEQKINDYLTIQANGDPALFAKLKKEIEPGGVTQTEKPKDAEYASNQKKVEILAQVNGAERSNIDTDIEILQERKLQALEAQDMPAAEQIEAEQFQLQDKSNQIREEQKTLFIKYPEVAEKILKEQEDFIKKKEKQDKVNAGYEKSMQGTTFKEGVVAGVNYMDNIAGEALNAISQGVGSSLVFLDKMTAKPIGNLLGVSSEYNNGTKFIEGLMDDLKVTVVDKQPYNANTGEFDPWMIGPKVASTMTTMGMIVWGGGGVAKAANISRTAATQIMGMALTFDGALRDAYAEGMKDDAATVYATLTSAIQGMLEGIMPDANIVFGSKQMLKDFAENFLKDRNLAIKSLLDQGKRVAGELGEEYAQMAAELMGNYATNALMGTKLEQAASFEEIANIAIITTPTVLLMGAGNHVFSNSKESKKQMAQMAMQPELSMETIETLAATGEFKPENVEELKKQVAQMAEQIKKMPPDMAVADKIEVAPLAVERQELVDQNKEVIPPLQEINKAKIAALDAEILKIAAPELAKENEKAEPKAKTKTTASEPAAGQEAVVVSPLKTDEVVTNETVSKQPKISDTEVAEWAKENGYAISEKEDFDTATKMATQRPNHGMGNMIFGEEKLTEERKDIHTHTYEKSGKTLNWTLGVYENGKGGKRYLLYEEKYPDQIDAGAIVDKDGKVAHIRTDKDFRSVGLAQALLREIKKDHGDIVPSEPISKQGAKAIYRFQQSDANKNKQPEVAVEEVPTPAPVKVTPTPDGKNDQKRRKNGRKEVKAPEQETVSGEAVSPVKKPMDAAMVKSPEIHVIERDGVALEIENNKDGIRLSNIQSKEKTKGNAGKLLNEVIAYADQQGIPLYATADAKPGKGNIPQPELEAWYKRKGFVFKEGTKHITRLPKPKLTQEQKDKNNAEAEKLGWDNSLQALNSVAKRTGQAYTSWDQVPQSVREQVSKERIAEAATKTPETPLPPTSGISAAQEKLKAAKEKAARIKKNLGISPNQKERAKADFEVHAAYVNLAKEYIREGVKTGKEFAEKIGEKFTKSVKAAWLDATGKKVLTEKDFEPVEPVEPPKNEKQTGEPGERKKRYEQRELEQYKDKKKLLAAVESKGTTYKPVTWDRVRPVADEIFAEAISDPETINETFEAIDRVIGDTKDIEYRENEDLSTLHAMLYHKIIAYYREAGDMKKFAKWSDSFSSSGRHKGRFISAMQADAIPEALNNHVSRIIYKDKVEAMKKEGETGTQADDIAAIQEKLRLSDEEIARLNKIVDDLAKKAAATPKVTTSPAPKAPSKIKQIRAKRAEALSQIKQALKKQRGQMNMGISVSGDLLTGIKKLIESYIDEGVYRVGQIRKRLSKDINDKDLDDAIDLDWGNIYGQDLKDKSKQAQAEDFIEKLEERGKQNARESKGAKAKDPIDILLNTLLAKVNEAVKKEKGGKSNPLEKIAEGIRERNFSDPVWEQAMNNVKDWLTDQNIDPLRQAEIIASLEDSISDFMERPFANSQLRQAIKDEVKDLGVEINKIVKEHYSKRDKVITTLAEKLVAKLGLTPAEAMIYESKIADEVKKIFEETRLQEIRKMLGLDENFNPKEKKAKVANRIVDKIMAAINLGVMDGSSFQDIFAEKYGFMNLTSAAVKQLHRYNELINKNQGSEMSRRYMKDMMNFIEHLKPVDAQMFYTVLQTLAVRGMLTGLSTNAVNIPVGSFMAYGANTIPRFFANPVAFFQAQKAFKAAGLSGIGRQTFLDIMKHGYNIQDEGGRAFEDREDTRGDLVDYMMNSYDPKQFYDRMKNATTDKKRIQLFMEATGRTFIKVYQISNFAKAFDTLITHRGQEIEYFMREYQEQAKALGIGKFRTKFDWTAAKQITEAVKKKMGYDTETKGQAEIEVDQEILDMKARGETIPDGYRLRRVKAKMEEVRDQGKVKQALDYVKTSTLMGAPQDLSSYVYQGFINKFLPLNEKTDWISGFGKTATKSLLGFFLRISIVSIQKSSENIPIIGTLLPGTFYTRTEVTNPDGTKEWKWKIQDAHTRNQKLMVHAATLSLMALAAMNMFDWDDENERFILNPNRNIDITGFGHGSFGNEPSLNPDGSKRERNNFVISIRFGGKWYEAIPAKYVPQLLPAIAFLGGMRDEVELKQEGYMDKKVADQILTQMPELLNALTEQTYNSLPRTVEKTIDAGQRDGIIAALGEVGGAAVSPLRAAIYPNIYKDIYTEIEAFNKEQARSGQGFLNKIFKDTPMEDYFSEGIYDTFGNKILKQSRVVAVLETNPATSAIVDNLTEWNKVNKERYDTKAWTLKMTYHPSVEMRGLWINKGHLISHGRGQEAHNNSIEKIFNADKRYYQNLASKVYGIEMNNLWVRNEGVVKNMSTDRLFAKKNDLPKKAKVYFPEWHSQAMKKAEEAVIAEMEKKPGYVKKRKN